MAERTVLPPNVVVEERGEPHPRPIRYQGGGGGGGGGVESKGERKVR